MIILDWVFKGKGKTAGLTKTENIVDLFVQIYDLLPSVPILKLDSSLQGYEKYKIMGVPLNQRYAKDVKVPSGFPSMIMGFSEFMVWSHVLQRLKIPSLRDKFIKDFDQAVEIFEKKPNCFSN